MIENATDWERVKDLFASTFEAGVAERERALSSELDEAIRRRVVAMLAAHDRTDGPLDRSLAMTGDAFGLEPIAPAPTLVGRKLGAFRIVREIGSGGMGAVYEAIREDAQFDQRVAIKTLRIGAGTEGIRLRFHEERRILAGLQHANIAALYDGAITEDGLPYFVLEYVEGVPIDRYCNDRKLTVRARIELFLQVITAVQYAHQQLVVHRDIKPANILVTADGVVKLVDFGIAKVLDPEGPHVTTEIGTPLTVSYASPEQVRGEPITTAADVYSLGVVLYKLLTGVLPLDFTDLSLDRAISTLVGAKPPLPSVAASSEAAESMRAESREKLRRMLRGDLDAILMTSLRKEAARRYSTPREFCTDLERYLEHLPVLAVPDSIGYRMSKFVKRQRALVAVSAFAAVSLGAGAVGTLWEARQARLEAAHAASVSSFLQKVIGAADLSAASGSPRLGPSASVSDLLDSAAARLPDEFKDDRRSRAEIHLALGRAFLTQERWAAAEKQFHLAQSANLDGSRSARLQRARAFQGLALIHIKRGDPSAPTAARAGLRILEEVGETTTIDYARSLRQVALLQALAGSYKEARSTMERAVAVYAQLRPVPVIEYALAIDDHAAIGEALGSPQRKTVDSYRRSLAMVQAIPGDVIEKSDILWYAARGEIMSGNLALGESLTQEAIKVAEHAAGRSSSPVANLLALRSALARARSDTAASRAFIDRAMTIINGKPEVIGVLKERVQIEYAYSKLGAGQLALADSISGEAYQSSLREGNWVYVLDAAAAHADALTRRRKFSDAERTLRKGLEISRKAGRAAYQHLFSARLAVLYQLWGRSEMAKLYRTDAPPD
ncbi:MAG TPA: serine/threonine-protein kinase [Gemmatimonadaceae bacterium]|nr:serine/threonine-protein kinase [Gemmatimonadaceae bacterium]